MIEDTFVDDFDFCCEEDLMAGKLSQMPRKKQSAPDDDQPKKTGTDLVRVHADLAYKLGVIVAIEGGTIADRISPLLRSHVEKWYADALKKASARRDASAD